MGQANLHALPLPSTYSARKFVLFNCRVFCYLLCYHYLCCYQLYFHSPCSATSSIVQTTQFWVHRWMDTLSVLQAVERCFISVMDVYRVVNLRGKNKGRVMWSWCWHHSPFLVFGKERLFLQNWEWSITLISVLTQGPMGNYLPYESHWANVLDSART